MPTREGEPNPGQRPDALRNILNRRVTCRDFLRGAAIFGGLALLESTIDKGRLVGEVVQTAQALGRMSTEIMSGKDSIQDVLANLWVSREDLEKNPQTIASLATVEDDKGNVIKAYIIAGNQKGYALYETHLDQGKFTEYKAIAQLDEIEGPSSITTSLDGKTVIIGGEDPLRSGNTKLLISYDGGRSFKDIPWPEEYGLSGGTGDLLRITENDRFLYVLGNNGAGLEGGVGQFIIRIDKGTQTSEIQKAQFVETIQGTNFNVDVGGANDLQITSVDPSTNTAEMIASGSNLLEKGILRFTKVNYLTGTGTVEHITTVKIDGVDINLDFLYGGAQYTDSQGHIHFKTSNRDRQILYDIDLTDQTATQLYYGNLLDNKGIQNYMNGRLDILGVDIIGIQNSQNTWLVGNYGSTKDNRGHAVLMHLKSRIFYDLGPNTPSGIEQKGMRRKTISGQLVYELTIEGLGKVVIPINSDGSPIPDAVPLYLDRGLGTPFIKHKIAIPSIVR